MIYIDPNGESISVDSTGAATYTDDGVDEVYYWNSGTAAYATLQDADGNNITEQGFLEYVATVYAESGGDQTETFAIANVIENRADDEGGNINSILTEGNIYGYGSNLYNNVVNSYSNTNNRLVDSRLGAINALTGGTDHSNSAYFGEATTFMDPNSQNYDSQNWFVRMGWGTTNGTTAGVIHYLETTTHGATTFMQNNPQLHGNRNYP